MVEPRPPVPTVKFVDEYCQLYQKLFPEVRSFEAFKYLHVGMVSDIKRKTLPAIALSSRIRKPSTIASFFNRISLDVEQLRKQRLEFILYILQGRPVILIIDETGDKKKGSTTDYVKRQYIGNLGKTDNGIVVVTAYAVLSGMTFPLMFEIYKPRERLLPGDKYLTKPEIAAIMMRKLQSMGFRFNLVLADSLYGESGKNFISVLEELNLNFIVAPR
jgi:SRSO17 transposase